MVVGWSTSQGRKLRGFTLMELILVLTLLTIIVTAVVPNFRLFSVGRQAKYAATQFLSLTRYARTQAISEGRTYRLNFEERAFYLTVDDGSGSFVQLQNDFGRKYELPTGVTMSADVQQKENVPTVGTDRPVAIEGNASGPLLGAGRVLDFTADGMGDVGRVVFTSANGESNEVVSETVSDLWHVVDPNASVVGIGGGR